MRKYFLELMLVSAAAFCSCSKTGPETHLSDVSVSITVVDGTVIVAPSSDAVSYEYSYGPGMTLEDFLDDTSERISENGNGASEIDLSSVPQGTSCSFYAVAYDAAGTAGAVASLTVPLSGDGFSLECTWITESTAGLLVRCSGQYAGVRYYVGQDKDRSEFEAGRIEGTMVDNIIEYAGVNLFDLEPGTEYILFAEAYDRSGAASFKELSFTTAPGREDCFSADYEMVESDAYRTLYRVVPGANTKKVAAFVLDKSASSTDNLVMYGPANGRGHLVSVFEGWMSIDFNFHTAEGVLEFITEDPGFKCNVDSEIYIVTMDGDGSIKGIYRHDFVAAPVNPDAGAATAEISVGDITSCGATYTYVPGPETMGIMYDTIDADWFDAFKETTDYSEYYMHNRLLNQGYYFAYGKAETVYTEEAGTPGTRYYAAACPMNVNGPHNDGWGALVLEPYVTLDE